MNSNRDPGSSVFAQVANAFAAIRLGPGVVGNTATVAIVGLIVIGVAIWALKGMPWLALGVAATIAVLMIFYFVIAFRYAEKFPIPALIGGSHLSQLLEKSMSAKDPSIVIDQPPIIGAAESAQISRNDGG